MEQITPTNFARYLFGQITRLRFVANVAILSDDSAQVTLKNGQQFTVAVVHGKLRTKRLSD